MRKAIKSFFKSLFRWRAGARFGVYSRLLAYAKPHLWPTFALATLFNIIYSVSTGLVPLLIRYLFDDVFPSADRARLYLAPVAIILVISIRSAAQYFGTYLSESLGQSIINDLRNKLAKKVLILPQAYLDSTGSSTLVSRMLSDVGLVKSGLVDGMTAIFKDSITILALISVAFSQDWLLSLLAFLLLPFAISPVLKSSKKIRRHSSRGQANLGKLALFLQESILGARVVRMFAMQDYEMSRFASENQNVYKSFLKTKRAKLATGPLIELLGAIGFCAVLVYGGENVINGSRTSGNFFAFLTSVYLCYAPFKNLTKHNSVLQQGVASAKDLFEILDVPPSPVERQNPIIATRFNHSIVVDSISFGYDKEAVLHELSIEIKRGSTVALVGPSGGGKSTIIDLLCRFYDPISGRILIDDVDIRDLAIDSYRSLVSVVDQRTFLFDDTIASNISYGHSSGALESISSDEIERAARAANAHEFISALPDGYETIIGENGTMLSGGQRQRIAIARALIKDAPILFLDEATSALDSASEKVVQEALDRLMANRTTLVVAHRLSTVVNADRICVIVAGRVVESGTHAELLARGGQYADLFSTQFASAEAGSPG